MAVLTLYGADVFLLFLSVILLILGTSYALVLLFGRHRDDALQERCEAEAEAQRRRASGRCSPDLTRLAVSGSACAPLIAPRAAGASVGAPMRASAGYPEHERRQRARRQRRWVRYGAATVLVVALLVGIGVGIYFWSKESIKTLDPDTGQEWTERYHTAIHCGGVTTMVSRMRTLGYGKFVPVIRHLGDPAATVLQRHYDLGFNTGIFCHNNESHLMGSASSELHVSGGPPPGVVKILNLVTGQHYFPNMDYSSCIDLYFLQCSMDGKWSIVPHMGGLRGYIRANAAAHGGARWVQTTWSGDGGRSWGAFELIEIKGLVNATNVISSNVNVYFFEVVADSTNASRLIARYPAVVPGAAGVFETSSTDGVRWGTPVLVRAGDPIGPRVRLQPYSAGSHAVRVNLHTDAGPVTLYDLAPDGGLARNNAWRSTSLSWA